MVRKVEEKNDANSLFAKATEEWDRGRLQSARRLLLAGAKLGDYASQHTLGYFYDTGVGVKRDREAALYWYMKAFRKGYGAAASNVATIYRDEGKYRQALEWFQRAVKLKDADANLEIAKIYITKLDDPAKARVFLMRAIRAGADDITEGSREEAHDLLRRMTE